MLSLTRKTDYALLALAWLERSERQGRAIVSAREIAKHFGLPEALLMNVMKDLARAKLVYSTRGVGGGYSLAMPAGRITVGDVLVAIEGRMRLSRCANDLPVLGRDCGLTARCPIHKAVLRLHRRINRFLEEVTVADLVGSEEVVAVRVGGAG